MFRVLVVLFLMFSVSNVYAGNVRSRIKRNHAKKYKKAKSPKVTFKYNEVWFSKLNTKQKMVYLNTMSELAVKISRTGKGHSNYTPFDLLIDKAYARFNNGLVYSSNFAGLVSREAYGDYYPSCRSGESPCALYMGLVNGKALCSKNSTPTCERRGAEVNGRAALKNELSRCNGNDSSKCQTLRGLIESQTKPIDDYCNQGNRNQSSYCKAARKALADADIDLPTLPGDVPKGGNCSDVAKYAKEQVETYHRPEAVDGKPQSYYNNNPFWEHMREASKAICGADRGTSKIMGICNLKSMTDAGLTNHEVKSYRKGQSGFNNCKNAQLKAKRDFIAAINKAKTALLAEGSEDKLKQWIEDTSNKSIKSFYQATLKATTSQDGNPARYSPADYSTRLGELAESEGRVLASVTARYNRAGAECTRTEENDVDASGNEYYDAAVLNGIYAKIKAGDSLSTTETNQFHAATGMSVGRFKNAFCKSDDNDEFSKNLARNSNVIPGIGGLTTIPSHARFTAQARTANAKMKACQKNMATTEESQCGYHKVKDPNAIRQTSANKPIVAKNKSTGKCVAIIGYKKYRKTTGGYDNNGNPNSRLVETFTTFTPGESEGKIMEMSFQQFSRENDLRVYACKGDSKIRAVYCESDPEKIDPGQSVPAGCTNPHDERVDSIE